jgi:hypothetical protein
MKEISKLNIIKIKRKKKKTNFCSVKDNVKRMRGKDTAQEKISNKGLPSKIIIIIIVKKS